MRVSSVACVVCGNLSCRLIVSSATLEAEKFRDFFDHSTTVGAGALSVPRPPKRSRWDVKDGAAASTAAAGPKHNAVIFSLVGRQYPVGPCCCIGSVSSLLHTATSPTCCAHSILHADVFYLEEPASDYVRAVVDACLYIHTNKGDGDILAFLPGSEDIDRAAEMIQVRAV